MILGLLLAALTALPALAQTPEGAHPAIGRLNHAGFRERMHCTVSLVGPREALTAAHCVAGLPPEALHVLLGYDRGEYAEHLRVRSAHLAPGADIARLCLDGASAAPPFAQGAAAPGPVAMIGYPRSRAHRQRRRDCALRASDGTQARIDCAVEPGMSGAPVLAQGRVVGVMSATSAETSLAALVAALPPGGCDPPA